MSRLAKPAILAGALLCAGCASAVEGSTQLISVSSLPNGADCTLSNARGSWNVTSPGSVTIKKSESVLSVQCKKPGYQDGKYYASGKISTVGLVGAFLPYAGLVSAAVDNSTGAAVVYPSEIAIELKPDAPPAEAAPTDSPRP